ncbi:MAG: immunoglobulin domain-containing protein, partial [Bacteroidota bacterium]
VLMEALDSSTAVSRSVPVQVNPNPIATTTPAGKQIICDGDSVILVSSTGTKYNWRKGTIGSNNLSIIQGEVSRKLVVKQSGIYSVTVDNEFSCQTESSIDTVDVRTLPNPGFTLPNDTACVGDTITLTSSLGSTAIPSYKYQWYQDGKVITGATQPVYKATVTGNYYLEVTNDAGCKNALSDRQITYLFFNALPVVNWLTKDSARICETEMYTMKVGNFVSYQWYYKNTIAGTYSAIMGAITNQYTTGTQGYYTVEVIDTNTCKSPMSAPFFLRVDTIPDIMTTVATSITNCNGANTIELCPGASLNLVGSVTNGGKKPLYQWLKNNQPIDSSSGGQNDRITLTNLVAGDTYSLQVKSFFDCTTAFDMDTSNILGPVGINPSGDCDGDGKS